MKHWTFNDIVNWHKETFPNCTLDSQKKKFCEEYIEYLESKDPEELADLCIVGLVLSGRYGFVGCDQIAWQELNQIDINYWIDKKMEKNSKRTWIFVDGVYRHRG